MGGGATVLKEVGNAPKDTFSRLAAVVCGGPLFVIIQSPSTPHSAILNHLLKSLRPCQTMTRQIPLLCAPAAETATEIVHNVT
jgi:hypothetical protein